MVVPPVVLCLMGATAGGLVMEAGYRWTALGAVFGFALGVFVSLMAKKVLR